LIKQPAFNPKLSAIGPVKQLAIQLGFSDDPTKLTDDQLALRQYSNSATIYQVPESNVIGIKYKASDPATAADVANTIAETYVRSTQELQAVSTDGTRDWLTRQIEDLRRKVSAAESDVEKFRAEQGLLQGQGTTLGAQQVSELNSQITLAEAAASEAKARAREIVDLLNTRGSVDASSEVLSSTTVAALREQQLSATRRISELSATYLDNHPKMIAARKELRDVERQLRREALKVVDSLDGQAKVAAARAKSLTDHLEQLKEREGEANLSDVKLKSLEREATASRTLLESLLTRYADANANRDVSVKPAFARIIQRAAVPSTIYFPKPGPLILLSSLAGLLGGLGLAFLSEMMRAASRLATTPYREAPLEQPVQPPPAWRTVPQVQDYVPVAPVPKTPTPPPPSMQRPANSPSKVPFRPAAVPQATPDGDKSTTTTADTALQLATALLKLKQDYKVFASRFAGQTKFKTDVALFVVATARAIADQKKKVLVIDADASSHALEPLFDLEQGAGLSDLVEGKTDFTKIIRRDQQSTAHVISYGMSQAPETASALNARMPSIINNLEDVYDIVLVHAGDNTPSTPEMLLGCKSVIMIVPQNGKRDLAPEEQALHDLGAESVMHVTLMQETILS
jgi:polysaccharide biosynthesis transport protein